MKIGSRFHGQGSGPSLIKKAETPAGSHNNSGWVNIAKVLDVIKDA